MVIPSYWGRKSDVGWKEGDAVYDHPTPLDKEGTLLRAIQSTSILKDKDFKLVIIAVATAEDIENEVEEKVSAIIKSAPSNIGIEMLLFSHSHLKKAHQFLKSKGKEKHLDLLKLRGYSNIRNLCMFIPHILGSDIAVLIDDDEMFEDPRFISKAKDFICEKVKGKPVYAKGGFYLQADGDYHVEKQFHPWMEHWDQYKRMNQAFDEFIGTQPRIKETPFVFGGNMLIHRNLFTVIPFDPDARRGEDIDFLINVKMFGFSFVLDNQLSIKHLPPPKTHPTWMRLREDIYRFIYEREKIKNQKEVKGMTKVKPEDFDPYPGCFLREDLEEKVEKACNILSEDYLSKGDKQASQETKNTILLARTDAVPKFDPFQKLCDLQKRWQDMMEYTKRLEIKQGILESLERI